MTNVNPVAQRQFVSAQCPLRGASAYWIPASTQNHALNALVLLYKQVLGRDLGELAAFARAKRAEEVFDAQGPSQQETAQQLVRLGEELSLRGNGPCSWRRIVRAKPSSAR